TDIRLQSSSEPSTTIKIGQLLASGVGVLTGQVAARHVEITDWEVVASLSGKSNLVQKAPKITLDDFSAPRASFDASSAIDRVRLAISRPAATSAPAISVTKVSTTITPAGSDGAAGSTEYILSDVQLHGIHGGRIASTSIGRVDMTERPNTRGGARSTGEIVNVSLSDFDVQVLGAIFEEGGSKEETYRRLYRGLSVGPSKITPGDGGIVHV